MCVDRLKEANTIGAQKSLKKQAIGSLQKEISLERRLCTRKQLVGTSKFNTDKENSNLETLVITVTEQQQDWLWALYVGLLTFSSDPMRIIRPCKTAPWLWKEILTIQRWSLQS